jgi:hypothetical protein
MPVRATNVYKNATYFLADRSIQELTGLTPTAYAANLAN